jgi:hydrogenase nickel incorporation protein HypA/HybF
VHEVGLMQDALDIALREAARQGASRVHHITLRVGRLAGVEADALRFAFEAVTEGTPAAGAELAIETVPVVCSCEACREDFRPDSIVFACPRCGRISPDARPGRELEVASLEVS